MSLRVIQGGRQRKTGREYDLAAEDKRRARGIAALEAAGLSPENACLCVHQLVSGAPDAFARAYTYAAGLGVDANTFRTWCITHGFREVVGQTEAQPRRADACESCGQPVTARDVAIRRGKRVVFRHRTCSARKVSVADVMREFEAAISGSEEA